MQNWVQPFFYDSIFSSSLRVGSRFLHVTSIDTLILSCSSQLLCKLQGQHVYGVLQQVALGAGTKFKCQHSLFTVKALTLPAACQATRPLQPHNTIGMAMTLMKP